MTIILGTLNFDYQSVSEQFTKDKIDNMLKTARKLGVRTLDTAYYYNKSETLIGCSENSLLFNINSKANPWKDNNFSSGKMGCLNTCGVKKQMNSSLSALKISSLNVYFLHAWDYETPIEETLCAFDDLYRHEKYNKFGISNISSSQLEQILEKCENLGYVLPSVYQGMYNIYCRNIEDIIPIARDYDIKLQAYNPLAGGILTGKHATFVESGRFKDNDIYKSIFWKEEVVKNTGELTADISLRWLRYNSSLRDYDEIIIGCSSIDHLTSNIDSINSHQLNDTEKSIVNRFYQKVHKYQSNFFY